MEDDMMRHHLQLQQMQLGTLVSLKCSYGLVLSVEEECTVEDTKMTVDLFTYPSFEVVDNPYLFPSQMKEKINKKRKSGKTGRECLH